MYPAPTQDVRSTLQPCSSTKGWPSPTRSYEILTSPFQSSATGLLRQCQPRAKRCENINSSLDGVRSTSTYPQSLATVSLSVSSVKSERTSEYLCVATRSVTGRVPSSTFELGVRPYGAVGRHASGPGPG